MQIFSRSTFVGLFVGLLILGLSGGLVLGKKSGTSPVEEKTKAQWKFDSSQCGVAIDVHGNANLNQQTLVPGDALIWSNFFGESNLTVKTESNCSAGYTVSVYASNTQPSPTTVDVLADFWLKTEIGSSEVSSSNLNNDLQDWGQFSDTGSGNDIDLGSVDESDFSNNLNNVNGTEWIMDYKYEMDSDDIENQEYFVELTYVVASQ